MIEAQIRYISEALIMLDEKNTSTIEVKASPCQAYNKDIQQSLKKTVWQSGGCRSWYQDAKGNNTTIWPGFTWSYILLMKHFDSENYIF